MTRDHVCFCCVDSRSGAMCLTDSCCHYGDYHIGGIYLSAPPPHRNTPMMKRLSKRFDQYRLYIYTTDPGICTAVPPFVAGYRKLTPSCHSCSQHKLQPWKLLTVPRKEAYSNVIVVFHYISSFQCSFDLF